MATGLQRLVRRALLAKLKTYAPLTALVSANAVNPAGEPVWPFIVLRSPRSRPLRAANLRGQEGSIDVHAFARAREASGAFVETGEDHAGRIGGLIEACLEPIRMTLDDGSIVRIQVSDMALDPDLSPDDWHYSAQINWRALAN